MRSPRGEHGLACDHVHGAPLGGGGVVQGPLDTGGPTAPFRLPRVSSRLGQQPQIWCADSVGRLQHVQNAGHSRRSQPGGAGACSGRRVRARAGGAPSQPRGRPSLAGQPLRSAPFAANGLVSSWRHQGWGACRRTPARRGTALPRVGPRIVAHSPRRALTAAPPSPPQVRTMGALGRWATTRPNNVEAARVSSPARPGANCGTPWCALVQALPIRVPLAVGSSPHGRRLRWRRVGRWTGHCSHCSRAVPAVRSSTSAGAATCSNPCQACDDALGLAASA
jgi:hypothetical protein